MGTTTRYALPYPDTGSSVAIPRDIKALADGVDAILYAQLQAIKSAIPRVAWGNLQVAVLAGTASSAYVTVTFPVGRFVNPPQIVADCEDREWFATSIMQSASSATVAATWYAGVIGFNVTPVVGWLAVETPASVPSALTAGVLGSDVRADTRSTTPQPEGDVTAVCRTSGCTNANIPLRVPVMDLDTPYVVCGVCGKRVNDLTQA